MEFEPGERSAIEEAHEEALKNLFHVLAGNYRQIGPEAALKNFWTGIDNLRSLRKEVLGNATEKRDA